jgi:hypothetical protein
MRRLLLWCAALSALACFVTTGPAQAVSSARTWVSATGLDTNPCTQTSPCLTFAHAISVTNAGGEIDCLSGGDFGPVTIADSVTIDCGAGLVGAIGLTTSGNAVNITATSGTIILRNLSINGFDIANYGIFASGFNGTLTVQHCSVLGFGNAGVFFGPTSARGVLQVSDTAVDGSFNGIFVSPSASVIASVVLNRVELNGNAFGLAFHGAGIVAGTLRQSVVAESSQYGIVAASSGGVYFTVEGSSIVDNLTAGIQTGAAAVNLEVGGSTIGGNGTGVTSTAGSILTFGNNQFSANGVNGTFTPGGPPLE